MYHPLVKMEAIRDEDSLKAWLEAFMKPYFWLRDEQYGVDLRTGEKGRIDYLAKPRNVLIDAGFDNQWFGIEVKYKAKWGAGDVYELFTQAQRYTHGLYSTLGYEPLEVPFVCVFTNLQLWNRIDLEAWRHASNMMGRMHVAVLDIRRHHETQELNWRIKFASSQAYFDSAQMKRGKTNAGLAYYFGNTNQNRGLITDYIQRKYYEDVA